MDKNKVITTEQISTLMSHFPTDALKKNAMDSLVQQGYKIQGFNDTQETPEETTKVTPEVTQPKDRVGEYIASQGSMKEQREKVKSGEAGVLASAFSGAPIAPATKADIGGKGYDPLKQIGKTAVNIVSDFPSIVQGAANMVIHPIDSVKGMVKYYGDIATETLGAIKEAVKTGDLTRIGEDIQKAEIAMIDHPLQTVLAFEGARAITKGAMRPVETATKAADVITSGLDASKAKFLSVKQGMKDKGINFQSDSVLHQKTLEVGDTIGQIVEKNKAIADSQKELTSMTEKAAAKLKGKTEEIGAKTIEQTQKELELQKNKAELADLAKIQKEQVKTASDTTKSEFASKGFTSLKDMQTNLKDFFGSVKEKLGTVYEENLGNAPVQLDGFFSGIAKVQDYLRGISDTKTLKALNPIIENLKMRDMMTKYAGDEKGFFNALAKEGIEPKYGSLAEYAQEYPPLTSENFKGTRNVIKQTIKDNNLDALKNYDKNVTPNITKDFRDAIQKEYGDATLGRLDAADKAWADLMDNPLVKQDAPTLTDITKNWDAFLKNAEQLSEGQALVEKMQNYAGEQILERARQSSGEYSTTTLNTDLKKYSNILGDDAKAKIEGVISLNNTLSKAVETTKEVVEKKKTEVAKAKEEVKKLTEEQTQIKKEAKSIGETPDKVISTIKNIKTVDELNSFMEKTGKSIEDIRKITIQSIIEKVDPKLIEDKNVPFDVEKTGEVIKELKEIGKSEDGIEYKKVNNEILGEEGIKTIVDLEKKFEEYKNLKTAAGKNSAGRLIKGAFGAMLVAFGHFIWGGIEVARALTGGAKSVKDITGRERPAQKGTPTPKKPVVSPKTKAVISGVNAPKEVKKDDIPVE